MLQRPSTSRPWLRALASMRRRTRISPGNRVRVLEEGDELMESIWEAIDGAGSEVLLETYTIEPDRVGLRTMEALERAAQRGCHVVLMCDAMGSSSMPSARLEQARRAGVHAIVFNPPLGRSRLRRRFGLLQRDHRKLLVVDGRTAFTGGANLSEDYAGPRHGKGTFIDTHLRIEGPVVELLRATLTRLLRGTAAAAAPPSAPASGPAGSGTRPSGSAGIDACRDVRVQVLESSGRGGRREIQRELRTAILSAERTADFATPYFVPSRKLADAMVKAARRGVRVRLLTAGRSDVPVVAFAARHVYTRLLRRGVRIFEMDAGVMHAKTSLIDGVYAMVGSANLDQWSNKRNLELNVGLVDGAGERMRSGGVVARLQSGFDARISAAREVRLQEHLRRPWWRRLLEWLAYLAMRI